MGIQTHKLQTCFFLLQLTKISNTYKRDSLLHTYCEPDKQDLTFTWSLLSCSLENLINYSPAIAWTPTRRKPRTSPFSVTMATRCTSGTGYSRLLRYTKALREKRKRGTWKPDSDAVWNLLQSLDPGCYVICFLLKYRKQMKPDQKMCYNQDILHI